MERNREILEDTIMKLALQRYVEDEGKKINEEVLLANEKSETVIDEKQFKKFQKMLKKNTKEEKKYKTLIFKIGTAAAVLLLIFNVTIFTVPAMRKKVTDFMVDSNSSFVTLKVNEAELKKIRYEYQELDKNMFNPDSEYQLSYLPEKFYLSQKLYSSSIIAYDYYDENDNFIFFSQEIILGDIGLDMENSKKEYIDINGSQAILIEKDNEDNIKSITWRIDSYYLSIYTKNISKEELIKMAQSVVEAEK